MCNQAINFTCHFICISRVLSGVFQVHLGRNIFLILNCRKWPISAIRDAAVVVSFCDRDRVIVDGELQGPEQKCKNSI